MNFEHPPDPWEDLEVSEVVEKALCLSGINGSDASFRVTGAHMWKDVLHTMTGEEMSEILNPLLITKECCVSPVPLEP
jgi:hypothetical protein